MTPEEIRDKVMAGGKLAIERLWERKRKENSYIVVSENGKIVKLYPKDVEKSGATGDTASL